MDIFFLCIVIFLFLLAVFDLSVGVSNDAVNFLSSAVGARAASFKRVVTVAAVGVFLGAAMSNGMMDVARHGIFQPENLSFYDVTAIFMAVLVTDVILLDIFNSLGMPTSTTVSLVFELLGAAFVVALFKIASPENTLALGDFINTEKALSVILGIFLSVAIAFVFGTIVQFITRIVFTFEYKSRMKWKVGVFGGIASTAIIYFMLLKGVKDLSFMTPEMKQWVNSNTFIILTASFIFFTILMQILHWCRVNVFKVVVLMGTFSLAMAFAGNDLVNFIGIPLTSLSSYQDYMTNGSGDPGAFMMSSLNGPADTPFYFLIGAGAIMVVSLATSKKAKQVTQTTVGLSSQAAGDEMFGSSRIGRSLVRHSLHIFNAVSSRIPARLKKWMSQRLDNTKSNAEDGAAFDLVRGAVNLMLAGVLIAWGTSMKLPLSTTFVTFMVAMGTSLADKAWGRESAVFRITGVISVIGGWFITAGAAFIGAGIVVSIMHLGGIPLMIAGGIIAVAVLVRNNIRYRDKRKETQDDIMFRTILATGRHEEIWPLTQAYVNEKTMMFLGYISGSYWQMASGFSESNAKALSQVSKSLTSEKNLLKSQRRKLTLCMRRVEPSIAIEKDTWFHLICNMEMSMTYSLIRITEICREHVDNNFRPLPEEFREPFRTVAGEITGLLSASMDAVKSDSPEEIDVLRRRCEDVKDKLSTLTRQVYDYLHHGDTADMTVAFVHVNVLQESREFITSLRKLLRGSGKLNLSPSSYRSFSHPETIVRTQR